jgi:hypothetical protein
MQTNRNLGILVLSIWLIATGLLPLLRISLPGGGLILAILAIAAGVLLLIGASGAKLTSRLGPVLLSIWLLVQGAIQLLQVSFPQSGLVMAVLAVAAGALMLVGR